MQLPTLCTERLSIRQFLPTDWPAVYSYSADPLVMAYMPEGRLTEAQTQEFVNMQSSDQAHAFAVTLTDTHLLIGQIIFHPWFAPQTYEIGWVFHPAYHNHGHATAAALAVLAYGFDTLGLHRVIATCQPENIPSYRVMEKLGMRREGWFRQCIARSDGSWWDELFYAILADEWHQHAARRA
jgi:RimJ/RimL family protein N-acetyltransferase